MKLHAHLPPRWVASAAIVLMVLAGTTAVALANLSPSTFEGNDGNLMVDTPGHTDWCNIPLSTYSFPSSGTCPVSALAPNFIPKLDLPSGSGDDAFGQGSKEDNACPTEVFGSIPPNKSDLTRFYRASEIVGGNVYLYLAWERTNVLGSANMDFEFNQSKTACSNEPAGSAVPIRTNGDMLVTFDFVNGGGTPVLGLLRWLVSGQLDPVNPTVLTSAGNCFSSNTLPCWGDHATLTGANSEGAVNQGTVVDPITFVNSDGRTAFGPTQLAGLTFGEAALNLTGAGVFPPGQCESFSSAYLKSRSSASFGSEMKDFIAPSVGTLSNCGEIKIRKVTNPSGGIGFSYVAGGAPLANFSLNDGGLQDFTNVPIGSYTVTESAKSGWDLTNLACTASGGASFNTNGATVSITMVPLGLVDCTYTNTQEGAIVIKKVTIPSPDPTDTTFSFSAGNLTPSSFTLKNGGMQTYSNLVPGNGYSVAESVPTEWTLKSATCDNGSPITAIAVTAGATTTCTFTNQLQFGAILITKQSSKDSAAVAGAMFAITDSNNHVVATPTTGSGGTACVDNLLFGSYTVTETGAPTGYKIDNPNPVSVSVDHQASCTSGTPNAPPIFTDTPLSQITVTFHSLVAGATSATIMCTGDTTSQPLPDGTPRTLDNLIPGTYTCTVVIDP